MDASTNDFKPITFVMRARDIGRSLESIIKFPYDKVWVEYYNERGIMHRAWPDVFERIVEYGYTHVGIFSDDGWCEPEVVKRIYFAATQFPVVCGWCDNGSGVVNITKRPLRYDRPQVHDWRIRDDLYAKREVEKYPQPYIRTWFSGFSLHVMGVELWKRFPFLCNTTLAKNGCASDHSMCWRLQEAGIPITAVRDARIGHIAKNEKDLEENRIFVGDRPENIRWETT